MNVSEITLLRHEASALRRTARALAGDYAERGGWDALLREAAHAAGRLPNRVLDAFYDMRVAEESDAVLVSGLPVDDEGAPTPRMHRAEGDYSLNVAEAVHVMLVSVLGDPIGFESQQHGHFLNHIIPIAEYADVANASAGFTYDFGLHTEDAFHDYAPDFLNLLCIRNREGAVTAISTIRDCVLTDRQRDLLRRPVYDLKPNALHLGVDRGRLHARPILWGDPADPYLRINSYMNVEAIEDAEARTAVRSLIAQLVATERKFALTAGQGLYIDNLRAAHSRHRYEPAPDAFPRWLIRIVATRDLRKSRAFRANATSRTIALSLENAVAPAAEGLR